MKKYIVIVLLFASFNATGGGNGLIDGFADVQNTTGSVNKCYFKVLGSANTALPCIKASKDLAGEVIVRIRNSKYAEPKLVLLNDELRVLSNAIQTLEEAVAEINANGGMTIHLINDRIYQANSFVSRCSREVGYGRSECFKTVKEEVYGIKEALDANGWNWDDADQNLVESYTFDLKRLSRKVNGPSADEVLKAKLNKRMSSLGQYAKKCYIDMSIYNDLSCYGKVESNLASITSELKASGLSWSDLGSARLANENIAKAKRRYDYYRNN